MRVNRGLLTALAVTMVGALTACASQSPYGVQSGVSAVPTGSERVIFRAPAFENAKVVRAKFLDPDHEREEYVLFQGGGAQAEILFSQTVDQFRDIVLEFNKLTSYTVETWNFNKGKASFAGASRQVNAPLPLYIHEFTNTSTNQSCFGFKAEWDPAATDRFARFTRQLFGYYCAPKGTRLNAIEIEQLANEIGVRGVTEAGGFLELAATGPIHDPQLEALVKDGSPAGQTGNAEFPFQLLRFFDSGGGGDI